MSSIPSTNWCAKSTLTKPNWKKTYQANSQKKAFCISRWWSPKAWTNNSNPKRKNWCKKESKPSKTRTGKSTVNASSWQLRRWPRLLLKWLKDLASIRATDKTRSRAWCRRPSLTKYMRRSLKSSREGLHSSWMVTCRKVSLRPSNKSRKSTWRRRGSKANFTLNQQTWWHLISSNCKLSWWWSAPRWWTLSMSNSTWRLTT